VQKAEKAGKSAGRGAGNRVCPAAIRDARAAGYEGLKGSRCGWSGGYGAAVWLPTLVCLLRPGKWRDLIIGPVGLRDGPAGGHATGGADLARLDMERRRQEPAGEVASDEQVEALESLRETYLRLREHLARTIVGQEQVVEQMFITLLCRGHCILEGVPGLAKTLMVSRLAECLSLSFRRIQFTPDLMPADITGTEVLHEDRSSGERVFRFVPGPVFANVVLADEINRTPPKTQAALLEAMQERQVTAGGKTHRLPEPFFVLATQNPIEQEGTYPLPEAQLDRFMMKILVGYPSEEQEREIAQRTAVYHQEDATGVVSAEELLKFQSIVRQIPCAEHVTAYAVRLVRATRPTDATATEQVKRYVEWGAGPRGSQYLVLAAKARAALQGRPYASCEDVRQMAKPVLRHRMVMNFNAEAEGVGADEVIENLLQVVPAGPQDTGGLFKGLRKGRDATS